MSEVSDIQYFSLFIGYIFFLIPLCLLWYYKTKLVKDSVIAIVRMAIQLLLVGFYLEFMFKANSILLNIIWLIFLTFAGSYTIIVRSNISKKLFFFPIFISSLIAIIITDIFFLGLVIKLNNIFDSRYFIPITGMLLGNTIKTVITALDTYYGGIAKSKNFYRWHLANGATRSEAKRPFIAESLRISFNPVIATTAIVGLISLPGMMTGQILGGSSPNTAIKYQIMIMVTIFASGILSVILTILISDKFAFDKYGNLRKNTYKI